MAVTAWKDPGTVVSQTRTGGSVSWTNPSRALSLNDSYATAALTVSAASHWLWFTNFPFTTADIPSGSTIVGIEAQVERKQTTGVTTDGTPVRSFWKMVVGGSEAGTQKTADGHLPGVDTLAAQGGATDMWGTTITDTDARASTTGFAWAFQDADYSSTTLSVDGGQLRYYYTAPAATRAWGIIIGCIAFVAATIPTIQPALRSILKTCISALERKTRISPTAFFLRRCLQTPALATA